jgi:hypothetical protein
MTDNSNSEDTTATPTENVDEAKKEASGPIGPDGFPMTLIEEREEIIETERKYNPDDYKYTGQPSNQELMMARIKLFETLTPSLESDYENGVLLVDEDRTRNFMSALETGDILGLNTEMVKIQTVNDDDVVVVSRRWDRASRKYTFENSEERTVNIYELDNALSMGFGQILYRNDKPFGLDKEMAYKVRVKVYADSVGRTYVFRSGREVTPIKKENTSDVAGTETKSS